MLKKVFLIVYFSLKQKLVFSQISIGDLQSLFRACRLLFFFSVTGQYRVLEDECLADKLQNEECK